MDDSVGPWYRGGLEFSCTRCGACCAGTPGFVWVDEDEMRRLADALGLSLEAFGKLYLRRVGLRYSLIEKPNHDCIFWDRAEGCTVYDSRPDQCKTWPFWSQNVETPADWERTREVCPGAGQGRIYSEGDILASTKRGPSRDG